MLNILYISNSMKFLSVLLLFSLLHCQSAKASKYRINHERIEKQFASAEQVELSSSLCLLSPQLPLIDDDDMVEVTQGKNAIPAFVLSLCLGAFGMHRAYLGTRSGVVVGYIFTCGGCGVLWSVDTILLLVGVLREDIEKYKRNSKFFMW